MLHRGLVKLERVAHDGMRVRATDVEARVMKMGGGAGRDGGRAGAGAPRRRGDMDSEGDAAHTRSAAHAGS